MAEFIAVLAALFAAGGIAFLATMLGYICWMQVIQTDEVLFWFWGIYTLFPLLVFVVGMFRFSPDIPLFILETALLMVGLYVPLLILGLIIGAFTEDK